MEKMLQVEIWTVAQTSEGNVVLLRPLDKSIAIPVFVGQLEIQSILIGMENITLPRPLTHDLFLSLLESQGLALDRVEIQELKGNTFHARLVISGGINVGGANASGKYTVDKPLIIDSRPSDALGIATRCKCPILVSPDIVKQTGIAIDFFMDMLGEDKKTGAVQDNQERRNRLQRQLNEAVEKEEYEEAAKIRDMLNELPP
ncbi:MAG: bifunctional nuclease family protein [Treponema sp.]|jgi:bifunctional DNase/RNase|nr:bifunctional nuclease family protein [Treponema sp.]